MFLEQLRDDYNKWALERRRFYVLSHHKPLTFPLHRQSDAWSACQ